MWEVRGEGGGGQHRAGPWRAPPWFESSPLPARDVVPREHPGDAQGTGRGEAPGKGTDSTC